MGEAFRKICAHLLQETLFNNTVPNFFSSATGVLLQEPLLDVIIEHVPPPKADDRPEFAMSVVMLGNDNFVGRFAASLSVLCSSSSVYPTSICISQLLICQECSRASRAAISAV